MKDGSRILKRRKREKEKQMFREIVVFLK